MAFFEREKVSSKELKEVVLFMRNASNTPSKHTFQHTLFDWLKFTWVPPNHVGPIYFLWVPCEF